jgi:hypothetical protein
VFAQDVLNNGYSVAIPKNSNVDWIYYSKFYNFPSEKVYLQGWEEDDKWWLSNLPDDKLYIYAPFESAVSQEILAKNPELAAKGVFSGVVLKISN